MAEYSDEVKAKIAELNQRCEELYEGKKIILDFGILGKIEVAEISWQYGNQSQNVDLIYERSFWEKFNKVVDPISEKAEKEMDEEIKRILAESAKLAEEVGEDEEKFFDQNIRA
jgi:hypothetical protein